jgi:hypothetical protein
MARKGVMGWAVKALLLLLISVLAFSIRWVGAPHAPRRTQLRAARAAARPGACTAGGADRAPPSPAAAIAAPARRAGPPCARSPRPAPSPFTACSASSSTRASSTRWGRSAIQHLQRVAPQTGWPAPAHGPQPPPAPPPPPPPPPPLPPPTPTPTPTPPPSLTRTSTTASPSSWPTRASTTCGTGEALTSGEGRAAGRWGSGRWAAC